MCLCLCMCLCMYVHVYVYVYMYVHMYVYVCGYAGDGRRADDGQRLLREGPTSECSMFWNINRPEFQILRSFFAFLAKF